MTKKSRAILQLWTFSTLILLIIFCLLRYLLLPLLVALAEKLLWLYQIIKKETTSAMKADFISILVHAPFLALYFLFVCKSGPVWSACFLAKSLEDIPEGFQSFSFVTISLALSGGPSVIAYGKALETAACSLRHKYRIIFLKEFPIARRIWLVSLCLNTVALWFYAALVEYSMISFYVLVRLALVDGKPLDGLVAFFFVTTLFSLYWWPRAKIIGNNWLVGVGAKEQKERVRAFLHQVVPPIERESYYTSLLWVYSIIFFENVYAPDCPGCAIRAAFIVTFSTHFIRVVRPPIKRFRAWFREIEWRKKVLVIVHREALYNTWVWCSTIYILMFKYGAQCPSCILKGAFIVTFLFNLARFRGVAILGKLIPVERRLWEAIANLRQSVINLRNTPCSKTYKNIKEALDEALKPPFLAALELCEFMGDIFVVVTFNLITISLIIFVDWRSKRFNRLIAAINIIFAINRLRKPRFSDRL